MISQIGKRSDIRSVGFTFIELLMVAAIILLLVAVSTPLFRNTFKDLKLKDAVYNISKTIQYAQQRSVMEEKKYKLIFDFEARAYRLLAWQEGSKEDGFKEITGRFGGYFYLPEGIMFRGETDKINFLPNGRCDKVSLYVANEEDRIFEITTNGRVGYVKVAEVKEK